MWSAYSEYLPWGLCWASTAARGLSLVAASRGSPLCRLRGSSPRRLSLRGAGALGAYASVAAAGGLSSCGSGAPRAGFSVCGARGSSQPRDGPWVPCTDRQLLSH